MAKEKTAQKIQPALQFSMEISKITSLMSFPISSDSLVSQTFRVFPKTAVVHLITLGRSAEVLQDNRRGATPFVFSYSIRSLFLSTFSYI